MTSAELIHALRARSGLSQRELAKLSRTSAAAICQYEAGQRIPRVDTLKRIAIAAGATLDLHLHWPATSPIDLRRNGRILEDLLDLADHLPHKATDKLRYPPFAKTAP